MAAATTENGTNELSLKEQVEIRKLTAEAQLAELALTRAHRQYETDFATDYHDRTVVLNGPVDEYSSGQAIATMRMLRRQSPEPIQVVFNSGGGGVLQGLAIYDTIMETRDAGVHVTTVGYGRAASMGGVLLQAGTNRLMSPNAYLMIHEIASGMGGKMGELEDSVDFCKRLWGQLLDILADRSTMTARQIKNRCDRKDWWLSASEALQLGFIDGVLQS